MKFDENLRALRKEKDFSQEYLAERMNVSRQTISKWENGTAMPDLKKLTELAELFDTSMDELLGTSSPAPRDDVYSIEDVNKIVKSELEKYDSKHKARRIITSLSIIFLAIGLIINSINIKSSVDNLNNSISSINAGQVVYKDSDEESSITDYVRYYITSIPKSEPSIAEVQFVYDPVTYTKNTQVTFTVADMASSSLEPNQAVAEESNGKFVANLEVNFASFNSASIKIDDGVNISNETLDIDWAVLYRDFTDTFFDYIINEGGKKYTVEFFNKMSVGWNNRADLPSITEAYLEAKDDHKVIYSTKLDINVGSDSTQVTPKNFLIDNPQATIYIKLVDEYGTRYYINGVYETADESENNISIEFTSGGRLSIEGPHKFNYYE